MVVVDLGFIFLKYTIKEIIQQTTEVIFKLHETENSTVIDGDCEVSLRSSNQQSPGSIFRNGCLKNFHFALTLLSSDVIGWSICEESARRTIGARPK